MAFQEDFERLAYKNWEVWINETSNWYDRINKKIAYCYIDISAIKVTYGELRVFTSSRRANLENFEQIDTILKNIKQVIYSTKYNEMVLNKTSSKYDEILISKFEKITELLSIGLSESELIAKNEKVRSKFKKTNTALDYINKALVDNNGTIINKNGKAVSKR